MMGQNKDKTFFLDREVGKSGIAHIEVAFQTLIDKDILDNSNESVTWYKTLEIDKSDASKIRRGLMIPSHDLRLKISRYFNTDSTLIWRREDMNEIRRMLIKQGRRKK